MSRTVDVFASSYLARHLGDCSLEGCLFLLHFVLFRDFLPAPIPDVLPYSSALMG